MISLTTKPQLRGVFHEIGFLFAAALIAPLVLAADPGRARVGAAVYSACLASCFGASALYHRPTWRPRERALLARVDHAGIYLLIAGTYTPVCLVVMSPGWRVSILAVVWSGAGAAILLKLLWVRSPKWLSALFGLTLGWVAIVAVTQLLKIPYPGLLLLAVGGVLYSLGAVVYARRWPDPVPHVFGYHEVFHVLTLLAAGCQCSAIAFFVIS